jgi:transcriptional regulator with XRE-family HTH domain
LGVTTYERSVLSRLSADLVKHLVAGGRTLDEVAALLGVKKSYVSRVKNRQRSLTVDHLVRLEKKLRRPLPLLLLEAIPEESVPDELKPAYRDAGRLFRAK